MILRTIRYGTYIAIFLWSIFWLWGFLTERTSVVNPSPLQKNVSRLAPQGTPSIGGPFELYDQWGKRRRHTDFLGRYMLVYFGYTYCPDICPAALENMTLALQSLGKKSQDIQPIFITIDPKRDTIESLKSYQTNYHKNFVMLTGSDQSIEFAKKSYKVYGVKVIDPKATDYIMDHSSIIYFMDRQGRYLTSFNHTTPPEEIIKIIKKFMN